MERIQIIVLYDHVDMPSEKMFCPSFWAAEDFDSDGDFYYEGVEKFWTKLELEKKYSENDSSLFSIDVWRERNRLYDPGTSEVADLARYVDYRDEGRYFDVHQIAEAKNLCVASLVIETRQVQDYREFLLSVYEFLRVTNGMTSNLSMNLDAGEFLNRFIEG